MATSIKELVEKVGLSPAKIQSVKWNTPINCKSEGVYIVSLSDSAEGSVTMEEFPISMDILRRWIEKLGYFTVDGKETKDTGIIKNRLAEFWLTDESILYIGKASTSIGNRVRQYYNTAIGESRPHAGGHWIKLLKNLNNLAIFYIPCKDAEKIEGELLAKFGEQTSDRTKAKLLNKGPILPFANLEMEIRRERNMV